MITLQPGQQLDSTVCSTRVVVVRAPGDPVELTCAGAPMVPAADAPEPDGTGADGGEPTQIGKRYENADSTLELLCARAGSGPLAVDGESLSVKSAKPLPSSD